MLLLEYPTKWTPAEELSMAATRGIASHLVFFISGEHHMKAPMICRLYVVLCSVLLYGTTVVKKQDPSSGTKEAFEIFATYTLPLIPSIVVYRKFFHRLRHFPGPSIASDITLWQTAKTLDSQNHIMLDGLYGKYGDFVRIGKMIEI